MAEITGIPWCHHTMNFWIGCSAVSDGCKNCYAKTEEQDRFHRVLWGDHPRHRTTALTWNAAFSWNRKAKEAKERRRVFTLSLGDFFDNQADPAMRAEAWSIIRQCDWLDWLILTKRPQNFRKMLPPDWGEGWPNVWLGVSVENMVEARRRMPLLIEIPAACHFLSVEPILEPIDLSLWLAAGGIDWVICGGESGVGRRWMERAWARSLRDQCAEAGAAFFMKQMTAQTPKEGERMIPRDLWIRQFPLLKREEPDPPPPPSKVERKHVSKKKRAGWVSGGRIVGEGARQHKYWLTPPKLKQALDSEFGFDFDPCPFPLPEGWNALTMPWGKTNYVNAPLSREDGPGLTAFVRKAIEEQKQGKTSVLILPMPEMFNRLIEAAAEVRSVGRVRFLDTVTREPHPAPFSCSLFVLRGHNLKKREEPVVERAKTKVGWPVGQFDVILSDPPWYYGDTNPNASAGRHYDLMSDEELMDMPVPSLLAPRGILFMWTTSSMLARSIDLMRHYGLEFRGVAFAWIKTKKDGTPVGAQGYRPSIVKPIIELVIAGSRVKMGRPLPLDSESICQTIFAPRGRHSEKPPEVHERLEVMYPDARKLEMFARACRPQWDAWGNDPVVLAKMRTFG